MSASFDEMTATKMQAEIAKLFAEATKLFAEQRKLNAEATKYQRDGMLAPWVLVTSAATATAALMGAGAALFKVLGG